MNNNSIFKKYSKKHIHFLDVTTISKMLENLLLRLDNFSLIDLGCGDGRVIYTLYCKGLLKKCGRVVGVDISKERIEKLNKFAPFAEGLIADVCDLKEIPNNSFDLAISLQVIEHVSDDKKMLSEVYRILKSGGYFYISTIIKKWYGFWIYYNRGIKLDPTHEREYKIEEDILNLLKENGFEVIKWKTNCITYPIIDLVIRALIHFGLTKPNSEIYLRNKFLRNFRKVKIPIIGYKSIEVLGRVKK